MHPRIQGFTLVEMLLAMTLLAVIMGLAFAGIDATVHGMRKGHEHVASAQRLRAVHHFLRRQLERTIPLDVRDDRRRGDVEVFRGDDRSARFSAPLNAELTWGGPYVHEIGLHGRGADRVLRLRYRLAGARRPAGADGPTEWESEMLLDKVRDMRLEYRYRDLRGRMQWIDEWDGERARSLPLAVRLQLKRTPGARADWPELVVAVGADSGADR